MPDRNRQFLEQARGWHERSVGILTSKGIDVNLIGPSVGRSKDCVVVQVIASTALIAVTIWDSGEYEVIASQVADDGDPAVELGDLGDESQVVDLLNRAADSIPPRNLEDGPR